MQAAYEFKDVAIVVDGEVVTGVYVDENEEPGDVEE